MKRYLETRLCCLKNNSIIFWYQKHTLYQGLTFLMFTSLQMISRYRIMISEVDALWRNIIGQKYLYCWCITSKDLALLLMHNMGILTYIFAIASVLISAYSRKVVDLTHTFDQNAPKYPLTLYGIKKMTYFNMTTLFNGYNGEMWWVLILF